MAATVLVAHASRHGSTREVAEAVAQALRDRGVAVDVQSAEDVRTLEPYAALVLGGAIYTGRWHRDARHLVHRYRHALAQMPVAIFGMGPRTLDAQDVADSRRVLELALHEVPEVRPVDIAVFGGVIDPENLHFPFNRMPAVDARDWDAIRDWAQRLPERLGLAPVGAGT